MTIFKKSILAGALAATAIASATPAMARDQYRGNGDNTAAVAVGAGILGLALGAIIASDNRDDRYYEPAYAYGPAYTRGWVMRDGYYWDGDGRRHTRDEYAHYNRGPQGGDHGRDQRGPGGYERGDHGNRGQDGNRGSGGDRHGDQRRGY